MNKFKGTHGEWFVSGGNEVVSMPSQTKISNDISGNNYEEAKANAKLIAAAPDMADALQSIVTIAKARGLDINKLKTIIEFAELSLKNAL
jgi:hypothetical protein